jgi:hypothetical protein
MGQGMCALDRCGYRRPGTAIPDLEAGAGGHARLICQDQHMVAVHHPGGERIAQRAQRPVHRCLDRAIRVDRDAQVLAGPDPRPEGVLQPLGGADVVVLEQQVLQRVDAGRSRGDLCRRAPQRALDARANPVDREPDQRMVLPRNRTHPKVLPPQEWPSQPGGRRWVGGVAAVAGGEGYCAGGCRDRDRGLQQARKLIHQLPGSHVSRSQLTEAMVDIGGELQRFPPPVRQEAIQVALGVGIDTRDAKDRDRAIGRGRQWSIRQDPRDRLRRDLVDEAAEGDIGFRHDVLGKDDQLATTQVRKHRWAGASRQHPVDLAVEQLAVTGPNQAR